MRLAVTTGDPDGIGPEIVRAACRDPLEGFVLEIIEGGPTGLEGIDRACDMALAGEAAAVVTGPVSKIRIADTGVPFTGHTEYLAGRCGSRRPVMMFVAEGLRVSLATTHLALRRIPQAITPETLLHVIRETHEALRKRFGILSPRLAVSGLNPHAGEGGRFGNEEGTVIEPAIALARREKIDCDGPFPADTIFRKTGYDAFVAMFHDQALPLIKMVDPCAVNVTLGLPFVRTSPGHGTAFDIAGKGEADPRPMRRAIELAGQMCRAGGDLF